MASKIKIGIIFPVRNCLDMTKAAIASIQTKHEHEIIVVDHFSTQDMKDWLLSQDNITPLIDPAGTTGLSFNWNLGIQQAQLMGCNYFLIVNNDIVLHPVTIDNLVDRMLIGDVVMATGVNVAGATTPEGIKDYPVGEVSETEHPDFSCFMITEKFIEKIGWFDENYKGAYMEDCDTHARVALAGEKAVTCNQCPYYHYASGTLKNNPSLAEEIMRRHGENQEYFARKWGRSHVNDVEDMRQVYYKTPFNDPAKTVKDW